MSRIAVRAGTTPAPSLNIDHERSSGRYVNPPTAPGCHGLIFFFIHWFIYICQSRASNIMVRLQRKGFGQHSRLLYLFDT
jgi:hypothetical protein